MTCQNLASNQICFLRVKRGLSDIDAALLESSNLLQLQAFAVERLKTLPQLDRYWSTITLKVERIHFDSN